MRAKIVKEFLASTLTGADVLHLPAVSIPMPTIAETTAGDAAAIGKVQGELTHCTRGINYLGLPAVAFPPVSPRTACPAHSSSLAGRSQALLLRAADAYQRATRWHASVRRQQMRLTGPPFII